LKSLLKIKNAPTEVGAEKRRLRLSLNKIIKKERDISEHTYKEEHTFLPYSPYKCYQNQDIFSLKKKIPLNFLLIKFCLAIILYTKQIKKSIMKIKHIKIDSYL